ncbi:MAG: DUF2258 domain-containing protein [Acidilobaceae archaeon]
MATLRSGYVIAGAYADKLRRTLFAQTRELVKSGELTPQEVARASGELNRILYEVLVNRLRSDKGDVVRISVNYEVREGRIVWDLETLSIQAWKRVPDEHIARAVSEVKAIAKELVVRAIQYQSLRLAETETGDIIYAVRLADRDVGILMVTPLNENEAIVRGAVTEPVAMILKRIRVEVKAPLDEFIERNVGEIMSKATHSEVLEAEKIIRELRALVEAAKKPEVTPPEEEEL